MTESVLMNVCIDVSASHDLETTAVLCIFFFSISAFYCFHSDTGLSMLSWSIKVRKYHPFDTGFNGPHGYIWFNKLGFCVLHSLSSYLSKKILCLSSSRLCSYGYAFPLWIFVWFWMSPPGFGCLVRKKSDQGNEPDFLSITSIVKYTI